MAELGGWWRKVGDVTVWEGQREWAGDEMGGGSLHCVVSGREMVRSGRAGVVPEECWDTQSERKSYNF